MDRDLKVGDRVVKRTGYPFESTVVSVFQKLNGETRLVCESTRIPGLLHIFSPTQMRLDPKQAAAERVVAEELGEV